MSATTTNPDINTVKTFVAELGTPTLEKVLSTFQGKRTPRTIAAAKRVAAKKVTVKVPRNLLRQLWRVTGGFKMELLKSCTEAPQAPNRRNNNEPLRSLRFGDMEVVLGESSSGYSSYGPEAWIAFRGTWCAKFTPDYNNQPWLNKDQAEAARKAGVTWTPAVAATS